MKKTFAFLVLVFTCLSVAMAQDIITLTTGEEMNAYIIRLNPGDVTFIPENSSDTAYLLREDVAKLQYKNGMIIVLSENEMPAFIEGPVDDSLFVQGQVDATMYYKGYRPAAIGTMVTSIYFPFGLIPAIACSSKPPAKEHLGYRDQQLMENPSYSNGYTSKAHEIKKKKVWEGFAIGSGFIIGLVILTSVAATTF